MKEKQELGPIELPLDRFFSIIAGLFWAVFLVSIFFKSCFQDQDPIIKLCVLDGLLNIMAMALLFWFYHSQKWPSISPLKMHPLDCLVAGIMGVLQLFPLSCMTSILWQKLLSSLQYMLNIDCVEQPLLVLLRSQLTHEGQFLGIILLVVILAPIAEEIFFRYFLYRSWKAYMSPRRAMLGVAFIFALLHFNLAAFVPLFVMGIFLTLLYERCGNLVPCVLVHGVFNYVSILLVVLFS
ncbi:MAG: CPBP family intramembrane metalloprotease [Puniceicoccales bacterium]|jgi:membrane protease YdiL (CAAX protease family)|nr:CPBP family intramembrane metalloprotease [Puniceicoccales bacterium]